MKKLIISFFFALLFTSSYASSEVKMTCTDVQHTVQMPLEKYQSAQKKYLGKSFTFIFFDSSLKASVEDENVIFEKKSDYYYVFKSNKAWEKEITLQFHTTFNYIQTAEFTIPDYFEKGVDLVLTLKRK